MPGFGFSDQPNAPGWGVARVARAWGELMQRSATGKAGWRRAAIGGGAVVTALAHMRAPGLAGIHLNMVMFRPADEEIAQATAEERAMLADAGRYWSEHSGYMQLQNTRPQSVAFALADSPVGLAAWIYALFRDVTDSDGEPERVIRLDHMIDDIMLYWLPNAGASAAGSIGRTPGPSGRDVLTRRSRYGWRQHVSRRSGAPVTTLGRAAICGPALFQRPTKGGHFAAMENPAAFVDDIWETFGLIR